MAGPVTRFGFSTVLGIQGPAGPPGPIGIPGSGLPPVLLPQVTTRIPVGSEDHAIVSGHSTINDGGWAQYIWDPVNTATADGVLIIAASGFATGRWVLQIGADPYKPEWWGAKGDGVTDDTAAVQAAMDALPAYSSLYFTPGKVYNVGVTTPLWMHGGKPLRLTSQKQFNVGDAGAGVGSAILFAPSSENQTTCPILVMGATPVPETISQVGAIWCIQEVGGAPRPIVCLSDTDCGDIDGWGSVVGATAPKSGFTFERYIDVNSATVPGGQFVTMAASSGSNGIALYNGGFQRAFTLKWDSARKLHIELNTSGGFMTLTTTNALPASGLTHVAVTYDGHASGTLRVFINGVLDPTTSSVAAGSTLVQTDYEDFIVGGQYHSLQFPLSGLNGSNQSTGHTLLGSFRLSSCCLYTANFSPPTMEFGMGPSGTTNIAVSFNPALQKLGGGWTVAKSGKGVHRDPVNGSPVFVNLGHSAVANDVIDGAIIENLFFRGRPDFVIGGIYSCAALDTTVEHCTIGLGGCPITFLGGYAQKIRRCFINCAQNNVAFPYKGHCWGLGFHDNTGGPLDRVSDCDIGGGRFNVVSTHGLQLDGNFITAIGTTGGFYFSGDARDDTSLYITNNNQDDEGAVVSDFGIMIFGMAHATVQGNTFAGSGSSTCPAYQIGWNGSVNVSDQFSRTNTGSAGLIKIIAPPLSPPRSSAMMPVVVSSTSRISQTGSVPAVPLVDPASISGDVEVPAWSKRSTIVNFPSDANLTLGSDPAISIDAMWFGTLVMTDTGAHLTATRNVVFPWHQLQQRTIVAPTTQAIQVIGPTGTGVTVAAGKTAIVRDDGTNWVRVTPDV